MRVLQDSGIRVPEPLACSRHTIVMELIDAFPLRQIKEVPDPSNLYAELMEMILKLADFGLIHGDFNEFNILIKEEETATDGHGKSASGNASQEPKDVSSTLKLIPYLIDFPQMVSVDHANAQMYFDRDVECIKTFFQRRFHFTSDEPGPFFTQARKRAELNCARRLDVEAEASGYSKKMAKELEKYMAEIGSAADDDQSHSSTGSESINVSDSSDTEDDYDNARSIVTHVEKRFDRFGNLTETVQPVPPYTELQHRQCTATSELQVADHQDL